MDGDIGMTQEVFKNNSITTLGSNLNTTDTTVTVATGTGSSFPAIGAGQFFTATLFAAGSSTEIPNEIVYVTARSGDTMTIVRAQEGTTAQDWTVGDTFAGLVTAGFLNSLVQSAQLQEQQTNSAVDTGTANAGAISLTPAVSTLSSLLYSPIRVEKIASPNTGNYTLNVNLLGDVPVLLGGHQLPSNTLAGSQIFEVAYDGTNFELLSVPAEIPNASLATMLAETVKANLNTTPAAPSDVPLADFLTALGLGPVNLSAKGHIRILGLLIQWVPLAPFGPGSEAFTWDIPFTTYYGLVDGIDAGLSFTGSESSGYTGVNTDGGTAWTNNGANTPLGLFIVGFGV